MQRVLIATGTIWLLIWITVIAITPPPPVKSQTFAEAVRKYDACVGTMADVHKRCIELCPALPADRVAKCSADCCASHVKDVMIICGENPRIGRTP